MDVDMSIILNLEIILDNMILKFTFSSRPSKTELRVKSGALFPGRRAMVEWVCSPRQLVFEWICIEWMICIFFKQLFLSPSFLIFVNPYLSYLSKFHRMLLISTLHFSQNNVLQFIIIDVLNNFVDKIVWGLKLSVLVMFASRYCYFPQMLTWHRSLCACLGIWARRGTWAVLGVTIVMGPKCA